jgi:hypothetical protein
MGQTKDGWPARSWRDTGSAWLGLCPRGQHPRRPGRRSARAHSRSACADRARIPHLLPESSSAEAGKVEMGMAAEAWEDRCSAPLPFREDRDCVGFGARPAGVVQAFVVERQILESILVQRITRRKRRERPKALQLASGPPAGTPNRTEFAPPRLSFSTPSESRLLMGRSSLSETNPRIWVPAGQPVDTFGLPAVTVSDSNAMLLGTIPRRSNCATTAGAVSRTGPR